MIRRTMTATFLNSVANDPTIRPMLGGGDAEIDLTQALLDPSNIALETEHGGWFLQHMSPGEYELHTMFRKEGRGATYYRDAREALRWVFTRTDCTEILTKCPDMNPGAKMAALQVGFRERFHREDAWPEGGGVGFYAFTIDDWFVRDAEGWKAGQWFHQQIELAIGHESHPDDIAHDRAAGCAVLMMRAGMISKGVAFYNRWARFAGYAQIAQVGPTLVDIGTVVIDVDAALPETMKIVLIRG
jgi:hypothetical protein